jgi:probable phosphoglycerate mutase
MKTHLYFIRHGQSKANEINAFLGHGDLDLTVLGINQAKLTAKFLDGVKADAIYSSDLKRAYNTALETAKLKNLTITKSKNLREMYAGKWEYMPFADIVKFYPKTFQAWRNDIKNACPDGGESTKQLYERIVKEVERIAKLNDGKTVLIFSHATPIRFISAHATGLLLDHANDMPWPTNASVTHITYENGVFEMVDYSIDKHMGDLVTFLKDTSI